MGAGEGRRRGRITHVQGYVDLRHRGVDDQRYVGHRGDLHAGADDDYEVYDGAVVVLEAVEEGGRELLAEEGDVGLRWR